jgi:hypothetical protein
VYQSDYGVRFFAGRKSALSDMETDDDDISIDSDSDHGAKDDNALTLGDGCIDTDGIDVDNLVLLSPQVMDHATAPAVTPALSPSKQRIQDASMVISEYEREVASLKHTISLLQRRNRQLTRHKTALRQSNENQSRQPNQSRKDHCKSLIVSALNDLLVGHGHWTRVSVAKFIWDHLDGTLQPHFLKLARNHFRAHVVGRL